MQVWPVRCSKLIAVLQTVARTYGPLRLATDREPVAEGGVRCEDHSGVVG